MDTRMETKLRNALYCPENKEFLHLIVKEVIHDVQTEMNDSNK